MDKNSYVITMHFIVITVVCFCFLCTILKVILYKWLFSRVLKFANVHCRPASREFIFAVKYIQLSPKLTTCSN